jgi:hypothetical protein
VSSVDSEGPDLWLRIMMYNQNLVPNYEKDFDIATAEQNIGLQS